MDLRRQPADGLGVEQASLDQGEDVVRRPGVGPAIRPGRVDGLGLDAALVAFLGELAPERPANRRHGVIMVQGDNGVQGELAVVHALGDYHFVVAVRGLGADPGNVPVLGLVGGRDRSKHAD